MTEAGDRQIEPAEVQRLRAGERPPLIVDCREPEEHAIVHLEDAELVPLSRIPAKAAELAEREGPVVVYCHHGIRSLQAAELLRQHGVDARSMAGGIDRWSVEIDPAKPRY